MTCCGGARSLGHPWRGRDVGDFFSGSGNVARALVKGGVAMRQWGVKHDPGEDLTAAVTLDLIKHHARTGLLQAAMLPPVLNLLHCPQPDDVHPVQGLPLGPSWATSS